MADCPSMCEALHLPGPVRQRRDAPADGPPVHDRALPGAPRPDPRGGPRDRAVHRRDRRVLRRDRGRVRGDAAAARGRPLRPGLRGRLQRAARDARDSPRRRRARRREAPPADRAARGPGGDRARAQPGVARADDRGAGRHGRAAASTTTTTTTRPRAPPSRATRSRDLPDGVGAPRRPVAREQARARRRVAGPASAAWSASGVDHAGPVRAPRGRSPDASRRSSSSAARRRPARPPSRSRSPSG